MSLADRSRWNPRYTDLADAEREAPSVVVKRWCRLARPGRALDLAAGNGRNSLFLAERGFTVHALDIADVALRGLAGRHPRILPACVDLDLYDITPAHYSLIINLHFLNRRLFPLIQEGLEPGGVLIFESWLIGATRKRTRAASCRDYYLRPNELLHAFLPLNIRLYQENLQSTRAASGPLATLVAVKEAHATSPISF